MTAFGQLVLEILLKNQIQEMQDIGVTYMNGTFVTAMTPIHYL